MSEPKRAYGYIRVSTKQQAGEDRMGMEAQRQAITEYADRNGYTIVEWFTDEISGVKEDRPKLNEILYTDLPKWDKVEAVIAYKSDRIARDIKLYFYYLFVLERKRIKLISVSEQFDDDSGLSTVFRALMLFVAEQERKNISMRTKSGRTIKAQHGGYSGGKIPYGYTVVDGNLVVDPHEASMVREIFDLRKRWSIREVAELLNEYGYRTRKGGFFGASNIQSILNNKKTYEGYYRYGKDGEWVKGKQEPILGDSGAKYGRLSLRAKYFNEPSYTGDINIEPTGEWPKYNMAISTKNDDVDTEIDAVESAPDCPEPSYPDLDNEVAEAEETIAAEPVTEQPVTPEPPRPVTFVGGVFHA